MKSKSHFVITAGLLLIVSLASPKVIHSQCAYELLLHDGLKKGQTLSIRPFTVNELAPYHYHPEPLQAVQEALATKLQETLVRINRFKELSLINESQSPQTDLILEGTLSRLDEGSRKRRILWADEPSAAKMRVSGLIKRSASGETVLWFHCTDSELGGLLGQGGLFTEGGKTLIHRCAEKIAKKISNTILQADQKHISGKPIQKW